MKPSRIRVSREDRDLHLTIAAYERVYTSLPTHKFAPRIIAARMLGRPLKKGETVTVRNRNFLDVRRSNLVVVTRGHCQRAIGPQKGGTSRYKGVHWMKQIKRWRAKIVLPGGEVKSLGCYGSEREAAGAYDEAVKDLGLPYAYVNGV